MSNKGSGSSNSKIILRESDNIVSEPAMVADIFNTYFSSVAMYNNGIDDVEKVSFSTIIKKHETHDSIKSIKLHMIRNATVWQFNFQLVTVKDIRDCLNEISQSKSVGHDGLQLKFVKLAGPTFMHALVDLFNKGLKLSSFPLDLKMADVCPLFKKNDNLNKMNYRSVNLLPIISKIFEKLVARQFVAFFNGILDAKLSAYRKGYSCQHVLLYLTEYWRAALDDGENVCSVATDLSKAFDCMPHGLLIAKLHAYGISENACQFVMSYLSNRKQRVKTMGIKSEWTSTNIGVPQGSVLGPLLFNIFINDLFFLSLNGTLCNYADDSTHANRSHSIASLKQETESDCHKTTLWFEGNNMNANPDKFQLLLLNPKSNMDLTLSIGNHSIKNMTEMKILGITFDSKLNFNAHISEMCKRAARQINALRRLSKYLNQKRRISIYHSFIASNFNFSPVVWFFCGKSNSDKLEKLQERALKFVYNDYDSTYDDLLRKGNFLSVTMYRLKQMAIEVFKCRHGINPKYLNELFNEKLTTHQLRDTNLLQQNRFRTTTFGFRSFKYYGAKLWNSLPTEIKNTDNLNHFVRSITLWCKTDEAKQMIVY